jgi:XTP/dITP diphosphohydrolase
VADPLLEFADVMRRLRAECPWKAAQTHQSLARYLLEETHETLEALDTGDLAHLREELGDLLLQVFLHTAIAEEAGEFTLDDVASDATAKMVRRNPHVFEVAGPSELTPAEVNAEWERRKALEKSSRTSVLDGLPPGLPALLLADKVLDRLSRTQRHEDGGSEPAVLMTSQPMTSQSVTSGVERSVEVGEQLLALVEAARADGVDAEQALRDAVRRRVHEG